jgi:DNA-binding LytR/AlgR family response regulator
VTFEQKRHSLNKSLDELETLAGTNFYRANRKFLINRKAILDASQYFHRKLQLNLIIPFETSEPITVSKVKVTHFLNWLSEN